ncbi:MAG: hypothetical protein NVS4B10_15020 [Myxococcales bacterium]
MQLQAPDASAVVAHTTASPFITATRLPARACPVRAGEGSRVGDRGASSWGAASVRTLSSCGAEGALWLPRPVAWKAETR